MQVLVYVNVQYRGFVASMREKGVGIRKLRAITRFATKETALWWHKEFLPLHFNAQQSRYKIQRRKEPYSDIKRKLAQGMAIKGIGMERVQRGGRINIVRSGRAERAARAAPIVRAMPARATLHMMVPRYIAMRPKDPSKPRQDIEMTSVVEQERMLMRMKWQSLAHREIRADKRAIKKPL